ncbi:serine hydrolase domain-containing protein [Carboxylicivirga marina]|uniref:Serine hydrolase n=1 Tax=Carboxylicivirga marina TaxID=2800988 RepID=A0ABS1HLD8_9BACT|nr:serine hydrolase [Carboxylicivirga marina]MBK3518492.1 serine hydrolase [Carboxylicivirga marina]
MISARAISRADTLLQQLTVEEKVAMLFVNIPDDNYSDSAVVGNTRFDSYSARDIRTGMHDEQSIPFPNESTLRAVGDNPIVKTLLSDAIRKYNNAGYHGLITHDRLPNVSRLYIGEKSIEQQQSIRIIDFPCELLDELLLTSETERIKQNENKLSFSLDDYPALNIWRSPTGISVSFDEILCQDLLFWENKEDDCVNKMVQAVYQSRISESDLDARVYKLLNHQIESLNDTIITTSPQKELKHRLEAYKKSISIYQSKPVFPLNRIDTLSVYIDDSFCSVPDEFKKAVDFYHTVVAVKEKANIQLLLCDDDKLLGNQIKQVVNDSAKNQINVLLFVGDLSNASLQNALKVVDAIVVMPELIEYSWSLLAEAIYNGIPVSGYSVFHDELARVGFERVNTGKDRLAFSLLNSEIKPDSISKIDSIISDAIKKKATPGAQLLVVKGGEILLQKAYGHHTYSKRQRVLNDDLYDVASITKLAVTFPVVMQMYENGSLDLDATLGEYLAGVDTTDKADITVRELLLHQSGLTSYIPFHYKALDRESLKKRSLYSRHYSWLYNVRVDTRLYQNKQARYRQDVFAKQASEEYSRQLTANMFMNDAYVDSMYSHIYESKLNISKTYRYSDLGYYLLQKIIESEEDERLDSLYYKNISLLLGANKLLYKPLNQFNGKRIVPTENDLGFRKVLLDGYVHDQGAAMLGGVAAHAGLFANAGDLAKLAQMLLNEGSYGGVQFFRPRTIGKFTQTNNNGNRRGLGVDKPQLDPDKDSHVSAKASPASYGHTGFTGTILWIDPEYDLIYIFLSNRIHPRSYNKKLLELDVRTKIQDVIYNSLDN